MGKGTPKIFIKKLLDPKFSLVFVELDVEKILK